MEQIAIVARLKSGAEPRAAELIAAGPPFDPIEVGWSGTPSFSPQMRSCSFSKVARWSGSSMDSSTSRSIGLFSLRSTTGGRCSTATRGSPGRCSPGSGKSSTRPRRPEQMLRLSTDTRP